LRLRDGEYVDAGGSEAAIGFVAAEPFAVQITPAH